MQTAEILKFQPKEVVRVAEIENGYTRISNELLEAIASHSFTSRQYKILISVILKTYRFHKKIDWIANSQFEKLSGLPSTTCSKVKNELIKMGVLISNGRECGINKNISEWKLKVDQNNKCFTKTVKKSFTKTVKDPLPKQSNTKETITKEYINNHMSSTDDVRASKSKKIKPDYQAVLEAYQEVVLDGLPIPDKLNKRRKTLINHLFSEIKNPSIETVKKYFTGLMDQVKDKPFYFGGPNRDGWRLNFDYALHVDTLTKTREGAL